MTDRPGDREQEQKRRNARHQGLAYQGAFEAVIAIMIAGGLGAWADSHFGTSPRYLVVGTAIGSSGADTGSRAGLGVQSVSAGKSKPA